MSEPTVAVPVEPIEGVKPTPTDDDPLSGLTPEARKIFEETQAGMMSALKKEREANSSAAEKLAAMEKENQDRLEKQLKEQGKYKELAEERAKALAEMQPKADQLEAAQATLKQVLAAQIEQIPEDKRSLVPDKLSTEDQLEWISQNRALLSKKTPFNIGAGQQGGTDNGGDSLTAEELAMCKKMNVSPADYAKQKKVPV